jgi:hypothetical protein
VAMMDCVPVPLHLLQSPAWRAMSESARALWLDLAGLAWQAKYRGFVCDSMGRPWSLEAIAQLTGRRPKEVQKGIGQLIQGGFLIQTPDGVLFIPALVERAGLSKKRQEAARKRWHSPQEYPLLGCKRCKMLCKIDANWYAKPYAKRVAVHSGLVPPPQGSHLGYCKVLFEISHPHTFILPDFWHIAIHKRQVCRPTGAEASRSLRSRAPA